MLEQNEKLLNISGSINEDDEMKIINNTFFKLFCFGKYQQDTEKTNFRQIKVSEGRICRRPKSTCMACPRL